MRNSTIYALIAGLIVAIASGGWILWNIRAPLWGKLPDHEVATCGDLDAQGPAASTYLFARLTMHYEAMGGDLSDDAKIEAFGGAVAEHCLANPDQRLLDIVNNIAKSPPN